jgi:short-subunit dehydrogenase
MSIELKALEEQVIVITGASSGIGLATAQMAAARGAKLVVAARSEQTLHDLVSVLVNAGHEAISVVADVSYPQDCQRIVEAAIGRFGRIDTWVNNAGVAIYGRLDQVSDKDSRRLFDINFWGVVNGSLAVLPLLRIYGGALINVGSEVSDSVVPLQGMYAASKHAVKGFTDALRMEIEEIDKAPVAITLIQPATVDTPYPQHAKNYMSEEPKLPTPQIDPRQVAQAILDAAVKPTRDVKVGAMARINTFVAKMLPSLSDKMMAKQADQQHYDEPPREPDGTLYRAGESAGESGRTPRTGGIVATAG